MDTSEAFMRNQASSGPQMVFDWHRAARLIKERNPSIVRAGLASDWGSTGGPIWEDGAPVLRKDTGVYLASNWATPEIELDGETLDCMKLAHEPPEANEWTAETYWPASALKLVGMEGARI